MVVIGDLQRRAAAPPELPGVGQVAQAGRLRVGT